MSRKFLKVFALLLVLLLLVAACSGDDTPDPTEVPAAEEAEAPAEAEEEAAPAEEETEAPAEEEAEMAEGDGGTYRAAIRSGCIEQGTLHTTCGRRLDATVMQGLAHINWTGDGVQPLLAESWETPDEGKTWIFNLREGVNWHDGEPFDADDVIFSLNAYANPAVASVYSAKLSGVEGFSEFQDGSAESLSGVTKIDDYTVQVVLSDAAPAWVNLQAIAISVLPEHLLGDVAPADLNGHDFWINRVGTGPFIWTDYATDQFVEVVKNPDYFLGEPKLDRIVYQVYADIPTIVNALETGEVDSMSYEGGGVPITELDRLMTQDHLTVLPNFSAGLPTYLQFNLEDERFADVRVRAAMLHAIDRQAIIDSIKMGGPTLSNTEFPAEWTHPDGMNPYEYDPDKAIALLEEAGWDSSQPVDFIHYYSDQVNMDTFTAIQSYLAAVGVDIELRLLDGASIQQVYADGTFEMGYFANGQGLDPSLGTLIVTCDGALNMGYCNERVDELFTLGLSSAEQSERAPYYQEIAAIVNEELPRGWLWYEVRPLAFNNRVVGLAEHYSEQPLVIFDHPVYNEIETWYVDEE